LDEARAATALMDRNRMRFEADVLPHLDAAYRFAVALTRSRTDAEDLVQEAMLRAYRALEQLRGTDARAWLIAIVRNCHFSARARERKQASVPLPAEGTSDEPLVDPSPDPESASVQEADRRAIGQSMAKLSPEHREMLVLREIEDMSYREIAAVMNLPIGTVMSRLARARAAFREQWQAAHGKDRS
jgi:RNA polymerase sigma factor (sigma-70 family)